MNGPDAKSPATHEMPRVPSRAVRTALSLAVLVLSLVLLAVYHARNWALVRDAVGHVARTVFLSPPSP